MLEQEKSHGHNNTAANEKNATEPTKGLLRWTLIGAAIGFLILLVVSVYHPYLTERVKFLVGSSLSLFVLLAVIVQAVIYRGQWKAMKGQAETMQKQFKLAAFDSNQQRSAHRVEMKNMELAAEVMRGQLEAMKGQLEVMKQQGENTAISARAYLGIKGVGIENPITHDTFVINAVVVNAGQTPAWNVEQKFQVGLVKGPPQPFDWNAPANQLSDAGLISSFFPNNAEKRITLPKILNVTPEIFEEFRKGELNIYVDGEIRFTDHLGMKQIFAFGMICTSRDNGQFRERYQSQRDANPN